jgi:predicted membrane protein
MTPRTYYTLRTVHVVISLCGIATIYLSATTNLLWYLLVVLLSLTVLRLLDRSYKKQNPEV